MLKQRRCTAMIHLRVGYLRDVKNGEQVGQTFGLMSAYRCVLALGHDGKHEPNRDRLRGEVRFREKNGLLVGDQLRAAAKEE